MLCGLGEFDRLLGGGIVPGSLILIGGDPGVGKSTLLLQVSHLLAQGKRTVLYISGEESLAQVSLRAKRLGVDSDNLLLFSETQISAIKQTIEHVKPAAVVVDSIQIVYKEEIPSAPGSATQLREATAELLHLAKGSNTAIFLIGHVTKAGEIAGPRLLEHMVDSVLYFEGDKQIHYRLLRVIKNRFGPADEIAVFQMNYNGLSEIPNPSSLFLEERVRGSTGSVIVPALEGSRSLLVEVQALVSHTHFSTPTRRGSGLDQNRLALLLAVLEKRVGLQLHSCDIFVSVAGGLKITEPGLDLGILLAVASSLTNKAIDPQTLAVGEVGLGGEVRSVSRLEVRLKEAALMGFERCFVPKRSLSALKTASDQWQGLRLHGIEYVEEAIDALIR
jgi:DNA repair protein RadA/Sms